MTPQKEQKHVLIITNDSDIERCFIRESVKESSSAEISIFEAEDDVELFNTLNRMAEEGEFPSLILLDFLLGAVNGLNVASRLRKNYPPIPVVVFGTCLGSNDFISDLYRMGINGYVVKPDTKEGYKKTVMQLLDIWIHGPQPKWSVRGGRDVGEFKGNSRLADRRRYARRVDNK